MEIKTERTYTIPETGERVDYATYRNITGKCETCGVLMQI